MSKSNRSEMYRKATLSVISMLEEAKKSNFVKPWEVQASRNAITGKPYKGVNILLLGSGSKSGLWGTYKQWNSVKARVLKGQKSTTIFFYDRKVKEVENEDTGEIEIKQIFICRKFNVFSVEQVDLSNSSFQIPETRIEDIDNKDRIEAAEEFFNKTGCQAEFGGGQACYIPFLDKVKMPHLNQFKSSESYYSTLFHELAHWTGAATRLDRVKGKRFGDTRYAVEELVAELSAIFTSLHLGLVSFPSLDSAKYINSWLTALKGDERHIEDASRFAKKATEYSIELQTPEEAEKVA